MANQDDPKEAAFVSRYISTSKAVATNRMQSMALGLNLLVRGDYKE
jgi:hypothetical protein